MKKIIIVMLSIFIISGVNALDDVSYLQSIDIITENDIFFEDLNSSKEVTIDNTIFSFNTTFIQNYSKGVSLAITHNNDSKIKFDEDALFYNFILKDYYGNDIGSFDGNVNISLPWNYSKGFIYYINNNGIIENVPVDLQDGFISFNTNHFSTFVVTNRKYDQILLNKITEKESKEEKIILRQNKIAGILGEIIIISGTLFLFVYVKKRFGSK